jgi:hypothetical protein
MVVVDFYFGRHPVSPTEENAPLLIDSYAPEAFEVARKGFKAVAWWDPKIGQKVGGVKL